MYDSPRTGRTDRIAQTRSPIYPKSPSSEGQIDPKRTLASRKLSFNAQVDQAALSFFQGQQEDTK